jgi:UDP-N-acetyl-D-glucosamine dehydrogenase
VQYHDPHVPLIRLEEGHTMDCTPYSTALLANADCVVIITDHSSYNWAEVIAHSRLVVDTRNAAGKFAGSARVVSL